MATSKNVSLDTIKDISRACISFSQNLHRILASVHKQNFVHSPLGLHSLLSLLSYGADKSTVEEMKMSLFFSDAHIHRRYKELIPYFNTAEDIQVDLSNAIYIHNDFPLIPQFLDLCSNSFYADVSNVDFSNKESSIEKINSWVKLKTKNKIQFALQSSDIDDRTRVILLNVIHFKGTWLYPFDINKTVLKDFHVSNSVVKKVPTMIREARFNIGSVPVLQTKFIEILYKNNEFAMVIFKPDDIDGIQSLEKHFNPELLSSFESSEETVKLQLPKFKFEVTLDLNNAIQQMDMKTMFSDRADFSKMTDSTRPLQVSKVFQKVYIDVNEEGTEVAAATGAVMRLRRSLRILDEFIIDRPFLFVIKHKLSGIPLFVGSVRDFESSEQAKDEL